MLVILVSDSYVKLDFGNKIHSKDTLYINKLINEIGMFIQ